MHRICSSVATGTGAVGLLAALLHGPSATAAIITSLAILVLACGVAWAPCTTAKSGRLTITIGRPSQPPTHPDP
jgi:hypothetical protein